jgi:hypothetical protein
MFAIVFNADIKVAEQAHQRAYTLWEIASVCYCGACSGCIVL